MVERDRTRGCGEGKKRKRKRHRGAETHDDGRIGERKEAARQRGGSRISSGFSTSFLQSVRLMRIRRPRLHPPASKSKAFAKVVTFHREDAEKTERMQGTRSRQIGEPEGKRERFRRDGKARGGTEGEGGGGEEWNGAVRERLSA